MENPIAVAQSRYGQFVFFRNDDPIGACLHYYGEWAQQEMDLFDLFLTETSNVIDVGANIGTHSVYFSNKCNKGNVFAIEPQLFISEILNTNLLLNGCFNVVPVRAACGSEKTQMRMMNINPFHGEKVNYGEFKVNNNSYKGVFTEVITLDSLGEVGVPFHLIKLDVEGLEVEVLNGATEIIKSFMPKLYIEFNNKEGNDELLEKIYSLDYIPYWHVYDKHNTNNFNNQSKNIWQPDAYIIDKDNLDKTYEGNIFCVHKSDTQPNMVKAEMGSSIYSFLFDAGLI
jgi:FkbM family methyltransferase